MTRREKRSLLVAAIVLSVVCAVLFARAVVAQGAADLARAQARAALLPAKTSPSSDPVERALLDLSGASEQLHYWQALQRFRLVTQRAKVAEQYTLLPLSIIFALDETAVSLAKSAAQDGSRARRSRLETMLGLTYVYDAELHRNQDLAEPQLTVSAIGAFRTAVLLDSSNNDAKTNLELLLQRQRRHIEQQQSKYQKPLPGQSRAENALEKGGGLPSQNGAVGRHFTGGY